MAPLMAPANVPRLPTDATALEGNMSEGNVSRLHDQPWCAATARLMTITEPHTLLIPAAEITGTTAKAQISIVVLRARLTVQPAFMNLSGNQPPTILPTVATL